MKIKLNKLFGRNKPLRSIVQDLSQGTGLPLQIHDANEVLLIESDLQPLTHRYPLILNGEILGWVSGNEKTKQVIPMLDYLIAEEAGKKSMADEVLNAYREITLLYNISEKLTASFKVQNVIQVALSEASRLIRGSSGAVMLSADRDNESGQCAFGSQKDSGTVLLGNAILDSLNQDSKAEIVNDLQSDLRFSAGTVDLCALVWAPLKTKDRLLGMIMIGDNRTDNEYTARDLGLLNTIASQTAPAVEKAADYENLEKLVADRTRELSEAKDAAEMANQAKSRFLANMSHELRTPLNALLGYAQILRQEKEISETQKDGLDIIHRSGEHLLTLINDILDLSKIEAGKMELDVSDFNLHEMLGNLSQLFRFRASEKEISFECNNLSPLPNFVRGDEIKLRQVLINLLSNSIKFTDSGSVVLKVDSLAERIHFEVKDTGIGIAANHLQEIFQSFRQVNPKDRMLEGTGLGLAISDKLVAMMGGKLQVTSKVGTGSTFWFDLSLPEAATADEPTEADRPTVVGYSGPRMKILVVEDRAENRAVLLNSLAPLGFEMLEARDGAEGLEQAMEHQPDLILMDLVMPVMDGFECMRKIRKIPQGGKIRIIALSASVFPSDRKTTIEAGGDDFLPKPVRLDLLLDALQRHLNLTWVYRRDPAGSEILNESPVTDPPPAGELVELFQFAKQGNVRGVRNEIDRIEALDPRFVPFVQKLRKLAKHFNMKQICHFLEVYVEPNR